VLRIATTAQDLGRIRVVESYGPLAETMLALGTLRGRPDPAYATWRTTAAARLTPLDRSVIGYLRPLASVGVDFSSLAGPVPSIRRGQEALLDAAADDFHHEVRAYRREQDALPPWLREGEESRTRLVAHLGSLYAALVRPTWPRLRDAAAAEASQLAMRLATGGIAALFRDQPGLHWDGTTLEIPTAGQWCDDPVDGTLSGRGIDLVPSPFVRTPEPYFPIDRARPAVLFLPIAADRRAASAPRLRDVGRLLGRTRTTVLLALTTQTHSTTSLADQLGLPVSGASQHVSVLRDAGLVSTVRRGGRTAHAATPLGRRLLSGGDPPA
jgi:DNA-binding transcriptional ArsR family regulator